jgi:hypothetical protein
MYCGGGISASSWGRRRWNLISRRSFIV